LTGVFMSQSPADKLSGLLWNYERHAGQPFDKRPGIAYYVSVAELLYNGITDSVFNIGDRLPSIRRMSEIFQTSEITIKKALALLKEEYRVINVSAGREAEVVRKKRIEEIQCITSFTREMELLGYEIESRLLAPVESISYDDELFAQLGGLLPDKMVASKIVRLRKIRRFGAGDDQWREFSIQISVVFNQPDRICFASEDLSRSLSEIFHRYNIHFDFAEQNATITTPANEPLLKDPKFAKIGCLKDKKAALFKLERKSFDRNHILRESLINFICPVVSFSDHQFVYSIETRLLYRK